MWGWGEYRTFRRSRDGRLRMEKREEENRREIGDSDINITCYERKRDPPASPETNSRHRSIWRP